MYYYESSFINGVRKAKEAGVNIVDVDGSYLHQKQATSTTPDPDQTPSAPLVGWEQCCFNKCPKHIKGYSW